ncbi:MAG: helix-turn-helix domain-containing protein, partial [Prevotella sp.]|nr:helix-turn-helix domain-containing protein [Prevotella sp.]
MEQKYIKASDVAEKFGVTRQTIRNWIDKGLLAAVKLDNCHYVTMESVKVIEDKYSEIVVVEGALEAYVNKQKATYEEYKASVELLRQSSAENTKICLIKPRLTELVRIMFGIVRVSQYGERRGDDMIELLLHGYDVKYIAEKYGISPERVHQIVEKDLRILNCEGQQYIKIKEENERLKEEILTLKANVNSLRSFREPGAENLEYSKVDVQESILTKRLVDCDISVRTLNCLKSEDIETVGDLARRNKTDLLKLRNFGKKCLIEIDDLLNDLGLEWGTNYMVNEDGEVVK